MKRNLKAMLLAHPEPWEPPRDILVALTKETVLRVKADLFQTLGTVTGRLQSQMCRLEAAEMAAQRRRKGVVEVAQVHDCTVIEVDLSKAEEWAIAELHQSLGEELGRAFEQAHIRHLVEHVLYPGPVVHCGTSEGEISSKTLRLHTA